MDSPTIRRILYAAARVLGCGSVQLALRVGEATRELPNTRRNVDVALGGSVVTFPGGAALQEAIDRAAK